MKGLCEQLTQCHTDGNILQNFFWERRGEDGPRNSADLIAFFFLLNKKLTDLQKMRELLGAISKLQEKLSTFEILGSGVITCILDFLSHPEEETRTKHLTAFAEVQAHFKHSNMIPF